MIVLCKKYGYTGPWQSSEWHLEDPHIVTGQHGQCHEPVPEGTILAVYDAYMAKIRRYEEEEKGGKYA